MAQKIVAGIVWCAGCNNPTLRDVAKLHNKKLYCFKCWQKVRPDINGESVLGEPSQED